MHLALLIALALTTPTDALGDPLPPGALGRIGTERLTHTAQVNALAFSPDGRYLASGGSDYVVRLWDAATGKAVRAHRNHAGLALAFTPDSRTLIGGGGEIQLWDVAGGKEVARLWDWVLATTRVARLATGGKLLLTRDAHGRVFVWELPAGRLRNSFATRAGYSYFADFSPDGGQCAAADENHDVVLYDTATGKQHQRLAGHKAPVHRVAFADDGKTLVTGGGHAELLVWDLPAGKLRRTLPFPPSEFALSSDGTTVAAAFSGGYVQLWDVRSGKKIRELPRREKHASALAFSRDGRLLATGDGAGRIYLWNVATGADALPLPRLDDPAVPLAFRRGGAELWLQSYNRLQAFDLGLTISGPWRPVERSRVVGVGSPQAMPRRATPFAACPSGSSVHIWDVSLKSKGFNLDLHTPLSSVTFAPDGRTVLAAARGAVQFLDAATGKQVRRVTAPRTDPVAAAISPDGKTLAIVGGTEEPVVIVRDLAGDKVSKFYRNRPYADYGPLRLEFTPGGRTLAVGDSAGLVLWDVASGSQSRRTGSHVFALSPDGRLLATEGHGVLIWEMATGELLADRRGFEGGLYGLLFSPDGRALASGGNAVTMLWDVTPGGLFPEEARRGPLSADGARRCWEALLKPDGPAAYRAMARLRANPARALALLQKELRPIPPAPDEQIRQWIEELDHRAFAVREEATKRLAELRGAAVPLMRERLGKGVPLEMERRLRKLILPYGNLETDASGEPLRTLRAVSVLEGIATAEARRLLERLASGFAAAEETRVAAEALARLSARE